MAEGIPNVTRRPTIEVTCSCRGQNGECVLCGGIGTVTQRSCMRCGGTGKDGGQKCVDCRGEGFRDLELL